MGVAGRVWTEVREAPANMFQVSIAVVLPQALLLHGEAGPMTEAFQPEQPARLPEDPPSRWLEEARERHDSQSLARLLYPISDV